MLELLNLYVIDSIFKDLQKKPNALCQMLYINCLIAHFRELEATTENAMQFELFVKDIPNFKSWQSHFIELHKVGLIRLEQDRVTFNNLWGQYIDRNQLDRKNDPNEAPGHFHFAQKFRDHIESNRTMFEFCAMRYKVNEEKYVELVGLFVKEQMAIQKKYPSESECLKHFQKWVKYNVDPPTENTVKSTGKILGGE